jgi:hypothetical protein
MLTPRRFGRKVTLPPTIQIKHQILLRWLEDQTDIEAAEARQAKARLAAENKKLDQGAIGAVDDQRESSEADFLANLPRK